MQPQKSRATKSRPFLKKRPLICTRLKKMNCKKFDEKNRFALGTIFSGFTAAPKTCAQ
jgi:hypothetical protein